MIIAGNLPDTTAAAIYTVPANLKATIGTVIVVNTSPDVRTINLYLKTDGINRPIIPVNSSLNSGDRYKDSIDITATEAVILLGQSSHDAGYNPGGGTDLSYLIQIDEVPA